MLMKFTNTTPEEAAAMDYHDAYTELVEKKGAEALVKAQTIGIEWVLGACQTPNGAANVVPFPAKGL